MIVVLAESSGEKLGLANLQVIKSLKLGLKVISVSPTLMMKLFPFF
jgi:hypothetical protein